jgi:hypothetical protein
LILTPKKNKFRFLRRDFLSPKDSEGLEVTLAEMHGAVGRTFAASLEYE